MKTMKKVLALLLALAMMVGYVPTDALAQDNNSSGTEENTVSVSSESTDTDTEEDNCTYVTNGFGEKVLYSESGKTPGEIDLAETYDIWDTFEFGEYPQSKVTDSDTIKELGKLEAKSDGYIHYDKKRYASVSSNYYLVEPIVWRVCHQYDSNSILIMSDCVLDSQVFSTDLSNVSWENSYIREWLNDTFYNTAFSASERTVIHKYTVDNSAASNYQSAGGNNTEDKIFLFSYKELTDSTYHFSEDAQADDPQRESASTEYAQAMGCSAGYCSYWTRSFTGSQVRYVLAGDGCVGTCHDPANANAKGYGVRPIMVVDKNSSFYQSQSKAGESVKLSFYNLTKYNNDQTVFDHLTETSVTIVTDNAEATAKTDKYGNLEYNIPDAEKVTFRVKGYYDYTIYTKYITGDELAVFMRPNEQVLETKTPYVSTVYLNKAGTSKWLDLSGVSVSVPTNDTNTYEIDMTAGGGSGLSSGYTYILEQDKSHKLSNTTGIFTGLDLKSTFTADKTVYAYVKDLSGTMSKAYKTKIKISSDSMAESLLKEGEYKILDKGISYTLPESIPIVGGSEIGLNLPSVPVSVRIEDGTAKVSLGIDIFDKNTYDEAKKKNENANFATLKENLKSINMQESIKDATKKLKKQKTYYNRLNTLRKNIGKDTIKGRVFGKGDVDVSFYGYAEFDIVDGQWILRESCGYLMVAANYNWTRMGLIGTVPVYFDITVGIDGSFGSSHAREVSDNAVPLEWDITLKIEPYVTPEVGVGIPKLASLGVNGKLKGSILYEFFDTYYDIDVTGSIGYKLKLGFFEWKDNIVEQTWNIASGTLGSGSGGSTQSLEEPFTAYDESLFTEYVGRTTSKNSQWVGSGGIETNEISTANTSLSKLQLSAYEDTNVQLVNVNGKQMLVWLEDNTERNSKDRTELVYSVYDDESGTWSEPAPVDNADLDSDNALYGTADFSPSVYKSGSKVYIIWQNTKKSMADVDADELTLADYAANGEIRVAVYDASTGTMSDSVNLTDNDTLDTMPVLAGDSGKLYAVWTNNDDNSTLGSTGTTDILMSELGADLSAGTVTELASGTMCVQDMNAAVEDGTLYVAYAANKSDTLTDSDAIEIYQAAVSGTDVATEKITNNDTLDSAPSYYTEEGTMKLVWFCNNNLYARNAASGETAALLTDGDVGSDMYQIVTNGTSTYAIWSQTVDEHVEIYGSSMENGAFTSPVALTGVSQKLINPSGYVDADGNIVLGLEYVTQTETNGYYEDQENNVAVLSCGQFVDLALDGSSTAIDQADEIPGKEVELTVNVKNNGTAACSKYEILADDEVVYTSSEALLAGTDEDVTFSYTLPEELKPSTLNIVVKPTDVDEENDSDNTVSVDYGNANLKITEISSYKQYTTDVVAISVENQSYVTSDAYVVEAYLNDADGDELLTVSGEGLESEHYSVMELQLRDEEVDYDEDGTALVYVQIVDAETEEILDYNTCVLVKAEQTGLSAAIMDENTSGQEMSASVLVNNDSEDIMQGFVYLTAKDKDGNEIAKKRVFQEIAAFDQLDLTMSLTIPEGTDPEDVTLETSIEGSKKLYDFTVEEGVGVTIDKYYGKDETLELPDTIYELPVIALGEDALADHPELKTLTIPETVTGYGARAFRGDSALTEITIGAAVTEIGDYCFRGCTGLETITVAADNTSYIVENGILYDKDKTRVITSCGSVGETVALPDSVTTIEAFAFDGRENITDITLGDHITSIGQSSFRGCTALTKINLPDSLENLGDSAFKNCAALTEINTGNGISGVSKNTFAGCEAIKKLTLGANISTLEAGCFNGLTNLEVLTMNTDKLPDSDAVPDWFTGSGVTDGVQLIFGDGVKKVPAYAFYMGTDTMKIASVTFPETLETIGDYAFYNQTSLLKVSGLDNVKKVGDYAFYGCANMDVKEVGEGMTAIGTDAFYGCKNITTVTIDENLETLGSSAFANCTGVNYIVWNNDCLTKVNSAFNNCGSKSGALSLLVGSNVTRIPDSMFNGLSYLTGLSGGEGVTSIGASAFQSCSSLKTLTGFSKVKSVGNYAFSGCSALTSIPGSKALETIGIQAFNGCYSLKEVTLPDTVVSVGAKAFYGASSVTVLTLGQSLKTIGSYAFANMSKLTEVTIPANVTTIGQYAFCNDYALTTADLSRFTGEFDNTFFSGCSKLTDLLLGDNYFYENGILYTADKKELILAVSFTEETLEIPDSVLKIRANAFSGNSSLKYLKLGDNLSSIGEKAFYNCKYIVQITWNESLQEIDAYAFYNCSGLTGLELPDSLTTIGTNAFGSCSGLVSVTFPANLTEIGSYAFANCSSLTALQLPDKLVTVGSYAFNRCSKLTDVSFDAALKSIGDYAFYSCSLTKLALNEGLESIGSNAFYGNTVITELTIPDSVNSIGGYAFAGMTALTSLTLGNGVTTIGSNAFYNCSALTELVIPDQVETIGEYAFAYMNALTSLTIGTGVKSIGNYAFGYARNLNVIHYNAAQCADFSSNSVWYYASYTAKDLTMILGDSVERIPANFTNGNNSNFYITSLTGGANVKEVGNSAFYGSTNKLIGEKLPFEKLETVGDYAFYGNTDLTELILPDTLKEVGYDAFYGCTGVTEIDTGDSLETVGSYAFYGCTAVKKLTLGASIASVGQYGFGSMPVLEEMDYNVTDAPDLTSSNNTRWFDRLGLSGDGFVMKIGSNVKRLPAYLLYPYNGSSSYSQNLISVENAAEDLEIGNYAFYYCQNLVSFTGNVPAIIGDYAFYYNLKLSEMPLGGNLTAIGNYAFYDCTALTSVEPGNALTTIGSYAFYGDTAIEKIVIPDSTTSIGASAFYNCTGVKELTLGRNLTSVGSYAFYYMYVLEKLNFNIANAADQTSSNNDNWFYRTGYNGDGFTLEIGENVTNIPDYLFYPYNGSSSCVNKVTEIINHAESLRIGDYAFYYCSSLKTADLTKVHEIGNYAFCYDSALTGNLNLSEAAVIGNSAFYNSSITGLVTGEKLTTLGASAFYNCTGLTSVFMKDGPESISENAFYNCKALTTLRLPETLKTIGSYAFYNCQALTDVRLPESLTTLKNRAFNYCGLSSVRVYPDLTSYESYAVGYNNYSRQSGFIVYADADDTNAASFASNYGHTLSTDYTAPAATGIVLADETMELGIGGTGKLSFTLLPVTSDDSVTFTSGNTGVVSVTEDGTLKGVSAGTTNVTVSAGDGISAVCEVTVMPAVSLSKAEIKVNGENKDSDTGNITSLDLTVMVDGKAIPCTGYDAAYAYEDKADGQEITVTVTGKGLYTGTCKTVYKASCQHVYGEWIIDTQPGYAEEGSQHRVCENCGDTETESIAKLTDSAAPTGSIHIGESSWESFLSSVTFGNYTSTNAQISIEAEDTESGIASVEYLISNTSMSKSSLNNVTGWKTYEKAFNVSKEDITSSNGTWILYAKLTDVSGNVTYLNSNGYYIDDTAPVIKGVTDKGHYCEKADVLLQEENPEHLYVDEEDLGAVTSCEITEAGTHAIVAVDRAGNASSVEITVHASHQAVWCIDQAATADTLGLKHLECMNCGEILYTMTYEYKAESGTGTSGSEECTHSYTRKYVEPDCFNDGYTIYTCSKCGDQYTEKDKGSALGHTYVGKYTEPDCLNDGYTVYTCSKCGGQYIEKDEGTALGHHYEEDKVLVQADYTKGGQVQYKCAGCGALTVENTQKLTDANAPTGTITVGDNTFASLLSAVTFDLIFHEKQTVTITAEDAESGIDAVYYYVSSRSIDAYNLKNVTWNTYLHSFDISEMGTQIVYAKLVDVQGNITYLSTDGMNFTEEEEPEPEPGTDRYTITFDPNGGTEPATGSILLDADTAYGELPAVTRAGYLFTGWFTESDGGTQVDSETKAVGNATVYAQWEKVSVAQAAISKLTAATTSLTVTWKSIAGAQGYEVRYSLSSAMKSAVTVNAAAKTSMTISKLTSGKKYYVQVRAYKLDSTGTKIYGSYSTVKYIGTTVTVSKAVISKLTAGSKKLTVTWKKISGVKGYQIRYSLYSSMKSAKTVSAASTKTSLAISKLTSGKKYYVQVRAYKTDAYGKTVYGSYSTAKAVKVK